MAVQRARCDVERSAVCDAQLRVHEVDARDELRHRMLDLDPRVQLEEAPSPAVDDSLRRAMSDAAVRFARAVGYENAGTAEFMLDGRDFFFLELNGRIQVEHPVTELVTGVDLVAAQIVVAQGGAAPQTREPQGHAIEVRLYAEDPRTFLPQTGRITQLRFPAAVRVDAGVAEGDEIGTAYDPMIAKLIAHAPTRDEAVQRLRDALNATVVDGVTTNLPFLRWLLAHPSLRNGETTTAFLLEHPPLSQPPLRLADRVWRGAFRLNLPPPPPRTAPDVDHAAADAGSGTGDASALTAPMPGTVIRVLVGVGDTVAQHQPLLVLEAMKMETPLASPYDAVVRAVHVEEGAAVAAGTILIELD